MKIAVIQHSKWEGPGRYMVKAAEKNRVDLHIVRAWESDFPEPDGFDGFVFLGGGANVHEEDIYPFLKAEKEFIKNVLKTDMPCLGICLGHQLLADALGASVGRNFCYSIGVAEAVLTKAGMDHPLFRETAPRFEIAPSFVTFKWHGQAVLLPVPDSFEILAVSDQCHVEAFCLKDRPHIAGVQFDNHAAHKEDVRLWLELDREWLSSIETFKITDEELIGDIRQVSSSIEEDFHRFFNAFIKICREKRC